MQLNRTTWLTLPEAAKYLFEKGIGDGTEVFILRLALARCIKVSVKFTKPTWANPCDVVNSHVENLTAIPFEADKFLSIKDKEWLSVGGIWDLPMIDGDFLEIEQKWRGLAGLPRDSRRIIYGVFLEGDDGTGQAHIN